MISADLEKNGGQKCSTGQRFIFTEVTFYKIHILVFLVSSPEDILLKYQWPSKKFWYSLIFAIIFVESCIDLSSQNIFDKSLRQMFWLEN